MKLSTKTKPFSATIEDVRNFKSVTGNRNVRDMSHIYNIMTAIIEGDYIAPVVISKDGYLLDGQHRCNAFIMACEKVKKTLTLEVIVDPSEGSPLELAIRYNSNRKNWGTRDYLNAYVTDKRKGYVILKDFMFRHSLDTKAAIQIIKGSHSTATFKAGALSITSKELDMAESHMIILNLLSKPDKLGAIVLKRDVILGYYQAAPEIKNTTTFVENVIKNKGKMPQKERSSEWRTFYLLNI